LENPRLASNTPFNAQPPWHSPSAIHGFGTALAGDKISDTNPVLREMVTCKYKNDDAK
jgi:hypothetical protein